MHANHTDSRTVELAAQLVRCTSVTPDDAGCQDILGQRLAATGFALEPMHAGGVSNLWARYGDVAPLIVFAGHTDVVPPGDTRHWHSPPFAATVRDGKLFGRGAADMKGSIAAMITAVERYLERVARPPGSIGFIFTSDEEGPAEHGTKHIVQTLAERNIRIDQCIVGEPSCQYRLGDTIRHGRRGSLGAHLVIHGVQGHVAYPALADNPLHRAMPLLAELLAIEWDEGTDTFPATGLQITNMCAGTGAVNVIPGQCSIDFNLRFCPASTPVMIQQRVVDLIERHRIDASIDWRLSAEPFVTPPGRLTRALNAVIAENTGETARLDTGGGTSDGRFITAIADELVEFGPLNTTIHQIDECVDCKDLDSLSSIFEALLHTLFATGD